MKLDPILTKAVRLARKKDYDNAIKTLESEHNRYYGKFIYYYLLGLSYLHSNIYGVALRYLNLAVEQKLRDPDTLLGLAALYLNHGDTDKAVDLYLEVQSIDESNKIAKRALAIIRSNPGPDKISSWIDSGKLHTIFPPFPKIDLSARTIVVRSLTVLAVLGIVLGISLGIALGTGFISLPQRGARPVPAEAILSDEERGSPVQTGGVYRYVLTTNQVLDLYNEAQRLFISNRDDAARLRLNRILESNASEPVKNRARVLASFLQTPGFDTLRDRFSYAEVIQEPFLYRDVHVIWRGMAGNLLVENENTSFDLLVGYDTRRVLEGIVPISFDFAVPVNPERPVEVLGRIVPVSGEREAGIRLLGVSINQAGLLDRIP